MSKILNSLNFLQDWSWSKKTRSTKSKQDEGAIPKEAGGTGVDMQEITRGDSFPDRNEQYN